LNLRTTDGIKNLLAGLVLVFSFLIYNATKAPTLSFWDCGEFIASSYVLGIPHPPGTPLYIILGRVFTLIPFHEDLSARINMLSAMAGAIAAMLAFLITFRLIRYWWKSDAFDGWKRAAAFIGAIVGSMMFAFGRTHWNNSMEAEVYTPAMLLLMVMFYLILNWIDNRDKKTSDRYLFAITYLGFLSLGIHMTTFLFMPAFFLIAILFSERLRKDFRFYITGLVLYLLPVDFDYFLIATGLWLIVTLIATLTTGQRQWRFVLMMIVAAIIGFSSQLYTPIRSGQRPALNQNNPSESYAAFKQFLERKQYGEQSMIIRALTRRADWANQLGNHRRMGFWGFFSNQYGLNGRAFSLLFVIGLLGLFEMARRRPKIGWPVFFMVFLGTLFLVWYMNFADGSRQDPITAEGHLEVRDRDYFFTPGFIMFGMAIGLGVAGLMEMARESILGRSKVLRKPVMIILSLLVFLAAIPIKANYYYCDRSQNYIPYDFAFNLLMSCEPNAILVIAGDNDTFPVWCLQHVYAVRPDVTTVNMALANTFWYLKQVRDYKGIPLRWNDKQIEALRHHFTKDGYKYLITNQFFEELLNVNRWQRPINFSLTVERNYQQYRGRSLEENLLMYGMVTQLVPEKRTGRINMEATQRLYTDYYHYRGFQDRSLFKDERSLALIGNYATIIVRTADSLRRAGDYEGAIRETKRAIELIPYEYTSYDYLVQLYGESSRDSLIPSLAKQVPYDRRVRLYNIWASLSWYRGNLEKADEIFRMVLDSFPHNKPAFEEYSRMLFEKKRYEELFDLAQNWLKHNPGDSLGELIISDLMKRRGQVPVEVSPKNQNP
jgi:tetratricopeptide (TPR) repeat protein